MRNHKSTPQRLAALALSALALAGCRMIAPRKTAVQELEGTTAPALGLQFEGEVTRSEKENLVGIRSDELLLSRRKDSRTYFVQNKSFGVTRPGGVFEGTDADLLEKCRKVSRQLGVSPDEIDQAEVLQAMSDVASFDRATGVVSVEGARRAERYAQLTRRIDGVPVFSSRVLLGLDRRGNIGFLELHWPEISPEVLSESRRLSALVERGWKAPEQPGANVETVQAGVLHSPAIGFVMDVQPVIRVVYAPTDPTVGKKPVLYLDEARNPAKLPRQFERLEVPPEQTRERGEVGVGETGGGKRKSR